MDKNVNKKGIAGVSLVEIMISLVLVAFALIAITTVFPRIMGHRKNIAEAEQANIIAMEVLDNLQYYSIYGCTIVKNGVTNGNINMTNVQGVTDEEAETFEKFFNKYNNGVDMGSANYRVIWNTGNDKVEINCNDEIHTVTVPVTWTKSGKTHKVKITGALR